MKSTFWWLGLAFAAVAGAMGLPACSSSGSGSKCTTGQSISCACPDGTMGAQVCQSDGTYAACSCSGGSGSSSGGTGSSSGSTGACQTASDCPPAQYAGATQVECVNSVCTYPGAFCNAGTAVCGNNCVCPINSQNFGQGCVCNSGYQLELCDGTPCVGSACDPNFKCGSTTSSSSSGSSSGGSSSGGTVCYQSSADPLCSCGTPANIGSCSINASYGSSAANCNSEDCCQTDQGGKCCDCASSSYLSTLNLTCASWISMSGGTMVGSCQ